MLKIKQILRLHHEQRLSRRQIAQSCHVSRATVSDYLCRQQLSGLSWEQLKDLDEAAVQARLFPPPPAPDQPRPLPDFADLQRQLKANKSLTLLLLWEEYKQQHPDGYQYSRFCDLWRAWRASRDLVMRQEHKAGEKLFVDYAGQTVPVTDPATGLVRQAQVFVAVLGASSYTYAEATWSQGLEDWTMAHVRALSFLGGVPRVLVPDNLKSGVTRPDRYDPELNPTYARLADHYGLAILPARVRRPRDKAKAEAGVQLVQRWILARLRQATFFSLEELNGAIAELLTRLNERPFRKLPGSRRSQFEALDRAALSALPQQPYEFAQWGRAVVGADYHARVQGADYSVPYQLVGRQLDWRLAGQVVELFHAGKRVAAHARQREGGCATLKEHMPHAHQAWAEGQSPRELLAWAAAVGPATAQVVRTILTAKPHPLQGLQSCQGLRPLERRYGQQRLEAACGRALALGAPSLKTIRSILRHNLDRQGVPAPATPAAPLEHPNLRGPHYYNGN
jgi:transposase